MFDREMNAQTCGRWARAVRGYTPSGLLIAALLLLAACQADLVEPPRIATQTAQVRATPVGTQPPIFSKAPTPTSEASLGPSSVARQPTEQANPSVTIWVNETSLAHAQTLEEIGRDFAAKSGIQVETILVNPALLPSLVETAVISGTLPDLIIHPIEYSLGWAERGILDPAAASETLRGLGQETFDPQALELLQMNDQSGQVAALPSDGWQQLLIYRRDWFDQRNLRPPETYASLIGAAEAIIEPERIISGLVVPTDSDLVTTQQVFEKIAIANRCQLVDGKGEITLLHPACLEALDFYRQLINQYSPVGVQTDTSALNAYLEGRTGMIMASPAALAPIAGLDEGALPECPECTSADYLAQNSEIVTTLEGSGELAAAANLGSLTNVGITSSADRDAAMAFANYWFEEAYPNWLAVNPERKVPMRWGTAGAPREFIDGWSETPLRANGPSLAAVYGKEVAERLSRNVATTDRWGFSADQGGLLTTIYQEPIFSPLLQDMLSGYFTSSQTIVEMYKATVSLIPDYGFPIEIAPTATP
jgi:multiple sugar transport system substrate-binding protein